MGARTIPDSSAVSCRPSQARTTASAGSRCSSSDCRASSTPDSNCSGCGLRLGWDQLRALHCRWVKARSSGQSGVHATSARAAPRDRERRAPLPRRRSTQAQFPSGLLSLGAWSVGGTLISVLCRSTGVVEVPPRCGYQRAPVKWAVPPIPAATITRTTSSTAKGSVRPAPVRAPVPSAFRSSAGTASKLPKGHQQRRRT